ncbi:type III secretory flagellar biosynthesis Yop translocation U domain protein, partial [Chlamydia psittaci 03DC29]
YRRFLPNISVVFLFLFSKKHL